MPMRNFCRPSSAHNQWWLRRGLRADLVILREGASGYQEPIRDLLFFLLFANCRWPEGLGGPGGIHLLAADRLGTSERRALEAHRPRIARRCGAIAGPGDGAAATGPHLAAPPPVSASRPTARRMPKPSAALVRPANLLFDNSLGGFTSQDGDYAIHLDGGRATPGPWSNVLANEDFRHPIVTEAGLGFSWCNQQWGGRRNTGLTPWSNDPVRGIPRTEALYLRDEETAQIWSPTPTACRRRCGLPDSSPSRSHDLAAQ